jgi:hypothetical protein
MSSKIGRFGGYMAWGTFLVLFGLLVVGGLIGISRLFTMIIKCF